jgi:hypothetical protein
MAGRNLRDIELLARQHRPWLIQRMRQLAQQDEYPAVARGTRDDLRARGYDEGVEGEDQVILLGPERVSPKATEH